MQRRLAALLRERRVITRMVVGAHRLGLAVDANLYLPVPPAHLDAAGKALARHPAVHGTLAHGPANGSTAHEMWRFVFLC